MKKFKHILLILLIAFVGALEALAQAPTFTSTAVKSIKVGSTYKYNIATDDPNGDQVVITAPTKADWINLVVNESNVSTLAGKGKDWGAVDANGINASFWSPNAVAIDASGNIIVADVYNNKIRKIAPNGDVTTIAGSGEVGDVDANGINASFNAPTGVAVDASGNIYVADHWNHKIRKIAINGDVTTLAGSGMEGSNDANGTSASFERPTALAADASGIIYIADTGNGKIRMIAINGDVTTLAGSGEIGDADANGTNASFNSPSGIAIDASGNIYVADQWNHKIRKIAVNGDVTTLAGSDTEGSIDANGTSASFNAPSAIAVDASGNVYVGDQLNHKIRIIAPNGDVTTLAGSGIQGNADTNGVDASFRRPSGVAMDALGNVYVADSFNNNIRKIAPNQDVSTLAGSINIGSIDASGLEASFNSPIGVDVDKLGNVYVADQNNYKIRKIAPNGDVTTLAGSGSQDCVDGNGENASFLTPRGVVVDPSGNVYVSDYSKIRKIAPNGDVTTLAGSDIQGSTDGNGANASFWVAWGITIDAAGNLYVGDNSNKKIRKVTPDGDVTTLAGSGITGSEDGNGSNASFNRPRGVAVDASGNVYVADSFNNKIRKITPNGDVTTLAGSGSQGDTDANGTNASFHWPRGITIDDVGNVYVADPKNHKIRKIAPNGDVTTFAGSGIDGGEDGSLLSSSFSYPSSLAIDVLGNMYVADRDGNNIRKITAGSVELIGTAPNEIGSYEVVLEANDGNGGITQQSFTIQVGDASSVSTEVASSITTFSANINGTVTSDENAAITERGFIYSKTSVDDSPTLAKAAGSDVTKVVVDGEIGGFILSLDDLEPSTSYSFAAYAINTFGSSEGTVLSFMTSDLLMPEIAFSDIDKLYGDSDITLEATSNSLGAITYSIVGESHGAILSGISNENVVIGNVGTVVIRASQEADGIYTSGTADINLTVSTKSITIDGDDNQSKVYGQMDPELTYAITIGSLEDGDELTGSLSREEGEDAGSYAISVGTLSAGMNYDLTFASLDFVINAKAITLNADENQSKLYGDEDPEFTFSTIEELESNDSFTGTLSREEGEDVGSYGLSIGTVTAGENYDLSFTGADFIINAKSITIAAEQGQSKEFGEVDPILTFMLSEGALEEEDSFTGSLSREEGEGAGSYEIVLGTLTAGLNYDITFVGAEFTINEPITSVASSDITSLRIYPNPTNGMINIERDNHKIRSIKLFDYSGQLLIDQTELNQGSAIDLSSFRSGLYILNIQTEKALITYKIQKD